MQNEEDINEVKNDDNEGIERPISFADFNGQVSVKKNLSVYVKAAKKMNKSLDHVLFFGPPGMGKTTLSQIIANELGVNIRTLIGPAIKKPSDIVSILAGIEKNDVVFIDEIHRLPADVEEVLYTAMEDFVLNVLIGEGPAARVLAIDLPRFTLVGATTLPGKLSKPFKDRFGIPVELQPYTDEEMTSVILRGASKLNFNLEDEAALEISRRCRSTPRIALRLLRRIHDHAVADDLDSISISEAHEILLSLGIDQDGLDAADRKYLEVLTNRFKGGPVGLNTIATAMGDSPENVEHTIEPFLIKKGMIDRTSRGRVISDPLLKGGNKLSAQKNLLF